MNARVAADLRSLSWEARCVRSAARQARRLRRLVTERRLATYTGLPLEAVRAAIGELAAAGLWTGGGARGEGEGGAG